MTKGNRIGRKVSAAHPGHKIEPLTEVRFKRYYIAYTKTGDIYGCGTTEREALRAGEVNGGVALSVQKCTPAFYEAVMHLPVPIKGRTWASVEGVATFLHSAPA